jgi:hypothetical protein
MKTGFFEEKPDVKSSTRLNSFIMLLFFIAFNILWIIDGRDVNDSFIILDLIFLLAVFAPKYLQKIAELKLGKNEDSK